MLCRIFNNPRLIYIIRDPRAVLNSQLSVEWSDKQYQRLLKYYNTDSGASKLEVNCRYIKEGYRCIAEAIRSSDTRDKTVILYEELVSDPIILLSFHDE